MSTKSQHDQPDGISIRIMALASQLDPRQKEKIEWTCNFSPMVVILYHVSVVLGQSKRQINLVRD